MRSHRALLALAAPVVTAVLGAAVLPGCSQQDNPIRTSLVDLTGESRSVNVYDNDDWFHLFPAAEYKQSLSIGGLLNIPDIGQEVNFMGGDDVTTTTGVAVVQSYRLIGEAEAPDECGTAVAHVRCSLQKVLAKADELSTLTGEIADLRARIDANVAAAVAESDKEERRRRRAQPADVGATPSSARETVDALLRQNDASLRQELQTRLDDRTRKEVELATLTGDLQKAANVPGIIVARWRAEGKAGASVQFSDAASASGSGADVRSGFVILGGLRVVSLVFGEDFWWLINNVRPHERKYIESMGLTTQLIQARDVAYVSDLSVERAFKLALDVRRLGGTTLDQAKIEGYFSFVGQFSNSGSLRRITWSREPFCCACSLDLPGLASSDERALQKCFGVQNEHVDPCSYQGWRTVAANTLFLKNSLAFNWNDHAAEYAACREMSSSPMCQFCGVKAGTVCIPGRHLPCGHCCDKHPCTHPETASGTAPAPGVAQPNP